MLNKKTTTNAIISNFFWFCSLLTSLFSLPATFYGVFPAVYYSATISFSFYLEFPARVFNVFYIYVSKAVAI